MKPIFLPIRFFVSVLLATTFACKHQTSPQPGSCRLISTTDQLMETNGRLTDEMQRTFTYTNDVLTSVAERSTDQEAGFLIERTNQRIVRATGGSTVITLGYSSATTQPSSATFSLGGKVTSTFVMEYNAAGRLNRLVESRSVLPANSRTTERAYTFSYDNGGNLVTERVRFTLLGGTVVEQQTDYVFDTKPSPYARFTEQALLTVVAMSQAVETRPGRFWHINTPTAYKSYYLTSSGLPASLSDSSTFAPTYDADGKLVSQDQNAVLYQLSTPVPITKRNRQGFQYQCD
jgi:hypothetical protein